MDALNTRNTSTCPQCGGVIYDYRTCPQCGVIYDYRTCSQCGVIYDYRVQSYDCPHTSIDQLPAKPAPLLSANERVAYVIANRLLRAEASYGSTAFREFACVSKRRSLQLDAIAQIVKDILDGRERCRNH